MAGFVKAFHLILVMLLMGGMTGLILLNLKKPQTYHILRYRMVSGLLWLLLLTAITGTFLVYPRHFNFHTHWIIAAYLLVTVCGALFLYLYRQQRGFAQGDLSYSLSSLCLERISLFLSTFVFLVLIHDAVLKQTFF